MRPTQSGGIELESAAEVFVASKAVERFMPQMNITDSYLLRGLKARFFDIETQAPHHLLPEDREMPFYVGEADKYLLSLCLRLELKYCHDEVKGPFIESMLDKNDAWSITVH